MLVTFSLTDFNLKKNCSSWAFHVDEDSESSSTYDMIIGNVARILGALGIIIKFNDHTVTWDADTIPMKDRDTELFHPQRYLLCFLGLFERK
jgi:hypothetical protein